MPLVTVPTEWWSFDSLASNRKVGAVIKVTTRGSFSKSQAFLQRMRTREQFKVLAKYGPIGVAALKSATPQESGETADAWYYEIVDRPGYYSIHWLNSHLEDPGQIPIAVLIQYGHATGNGGVVQGVDYINPALRPIFDQIVADMWREVTK
jgi:hypothetical protein